MDDYIYLFFTFLFALIVKDFYNIFIRSHIQLLLSKYKMILGVDNKKRKKP